MDNQAPNSFLQQPLSPLAEGDRKETVGSVVFLAGAVLGIMIALPALAIWSTATANDGAARRVAQLGGAFHTSSFERCQTLLSSKHNVTLNGEDVAGHSNMAQLCKEALENNQTAKIVVAKN